MKRVLSLFLSCIFVLGVCFSTPIVASAADEGESTTPTTSVGDVFGETSKYEILSEGDVGTPGTCALIKYVGTGPNATISGPAIYNGVAYTVTQINTDAFKGNSTIKAITIPVSITTIDAAAFNESAVKYVFLKGNTQIIGTVPTGVTVHNSGCTPLGVDVEGAYSVSGSTITWYCTCGENSAQIPCGDITLVGEDSIVYDGKPHEVTPKVSGNVSIYDSETIKVLYNEAEAKPTNAGTYTATLTIAENVFAEKTFDITPATITAELVDAENIVYNGDKHKPEIRFTNTPENSSEVELTEGESGDYTVEYSREGQSESTDTFDFTSAGNITVKISLAANSNYTFVNAEGQQVREKELTYTIIKGEASITTAPTVNGNLVYNGEAQKLVTPGSANGGTIYYTMTSGVDNSWSTEIPEGTNAGEYTVYYKVVGDDNHNNLESENYKIDVTIAKATATVTAPTAKTDLVYNGEKQELVVAGTIGKDQGEIQYRLGEDGEWSTEIPKGTNAGEYTVYYKVVGDDNHNNLESENYKIDVTIAKATPEVTINAAESLVFTNESQPLLTNAETTFGTLNFSLSNTEAEDAWSTEIPEGKDAGTYTVYYKVLGDSNVNDVETKSIEVKISEHKHSWTYEANETDNTITAVCNGAGLCGAENNSVTIKLNAPQLPEGATALVYDGTAKEATISGIPENFGIDATINYTGNLIENECVNAGSYTASITLGNETVSVEFTIAKAPAEFDVPTANTLTYNREAQALVTADSTSDGEFQYKLAEDDEWSNVIPTGTNAGTYTVYYQFVADDNHECDGNPSNKGSVEVTIEQMEIDVAYPIEDDDVIIYNGTPQQVLIIFTIKNDPSRVLTLDENEDYNVKYTRDGEKTKDFTSAGKIDALVEFKNDGNFKIVSEDDPTNYYTKKLSYTIQRKTITEENVEVIPDQVYTGEEIKPQVVVKDGKTTLTLDTDYTVEYSENTGVGTATVKLEFTGNYIGTVTKTFEIRKDIAKVTNAPTAKTDLVYDGAEKDLVTAGSATGGTMQYSLDNKIWNSNIPTAKDAGTYTVYYKVVGDANHSDSAEASISVTIGKAPVTISVETQERVYDGTNAVKIKSATVSDVVSGEEISVKFDGVTATSIEGTGVGTHTVGFEGDFELVGETAGNYEIGAVSGATVTITAKPLTITAKDATVVVNSVMPKFEYTIEGLVDSDSIANVEFVATVENSSTVVENTATVGTYVITPSAAVIEKGDTDVTKNYEITYKTGVFTVTACTKHEWKNSKCEICKIDCEHKYEDGKSAISNKATTQATCVKEGVLLTQCKICDYKAESPLDIVSDAHKMSDWKETVKATCSSTGTEERVCELGCGHKETRPTEKDPDNHTYGDWVVTEATCVADGVKVKTCKNKECKHELKETIAKDPTAHKMAAEWEVTKKPTCVETGLQVKACLNAGCDHEVEEVIAIKADAHNLGGWVVTKAAKCTIPGEITRFCKNGSCEYKVTDSLDPDGKNHDFAEDFTVIESTCVAKGSKFKVCENEGCKEVTEKTEIAINPAAHKNIVTINAKDATCEEKGYTGDKFCNDCKKTVDPGIEINAKGHTESDWIVDKEATFTEEGARHTACTVCKKELKKEVIVKLTLATPSPKAYNKTGCIKVKWADVDNALTYNVYRSEYVNKKWTTWKRIASGVKQGVGYYNDKNVTEGKQYKYTVKAYNGDFVSGKKASNKLIFISPVKPSLTTTTTGIILKWNTVLGADKYIAYRSQIVDGKWSDWKKVVTITDGKSSWVDTTAESGVTYKYSVRVYKGSSYSNREASTSIIFLTQPTLKLSNTSTGIKGSWKTVNGATGYVVTRAEYNDSLKKYGPTVKIGTASGTAKSFTDKTAKAGVKYKYTITAINGSYSSIVSPAKSYRRLAQPTVTIENTNGAIKGSWTQVTGAASYIIYRSEVVNGKWSSWKNLGTAGATAKSFTDKTVKSGVKYKYRVIAKNGGSKSSAEASNKLVYLTCPKATVSNSIYGAKVKWNVITGAESYIVYRKSYVNKQWTAWQQIAKTSTNSYTDSTAVSGAKYRYTIHAVNDGSLSARKDSASFVYVEAPKTTTTVTAKAITLNWNEIGGAKKYVVYRAELGDDGKWSGWSKVASLKDINTFADTTVVAGKTYKYKVNACIGKSKSSSNATSGVLVPKAQ